MTEPDEVLALVAGLLASGRVGSTKIVGGAGRNAVVRAELVEAVRRSDPRVSADQVDAAVEELGGRRSRVFDPVAAARPRIAGDRDQAVFELPRRLFEGGPATTAKGGAVGEGHDARVWKHGPTYWDLVLVLLAAGAVVASAIEQEWVFAAVLAVLIVARLVTWATAWGRRRRPPEIPGTNSRG